MERTILCVFLMFIFVGAVPVPLSSEEDRKEREKIGLECLKIVNIKKEVIEEIVKTMIFPKENQKYKDFLACSYKKQGFQSQEGHILWDNITEFISRFYKNQDLKILDKCKSTGGKNHGEMAFNAMECIMNELLYMDDDIENRNE